MKLARLTAGPSVRGVLGTAPPGLLRPKGKVVARVVALPDADHVSPLEDLGQIAAVRLFVERVRAVKPGFALSEANAPAVVEIALPEGNPRVRRRSRELDAQLIQPVVDRAHGMRV